MLLSIRTDLAVELTDNPNILNGIKTSERNIFDLNVTRTEFLTEKAEREISKPRGRYITIRSKSSFDVHSDLFYERAKIISDELKSPTGNARSVLVAGLGNREITPDSLGVITADHIFATRHIHTLAPDLISDDMPSVSVLTPSVMGKTGIETSQLIGAVVKELSPEVVIIIDSLACARLVNLAKTIQLSDTGITPGSGVLNKRAELSHSTLSTRVISIGVPTVVDMQTIAESLSGGKAKGESDLDHFFVTPKDIDRLIARAAKLISASVNMCLFPGLSLEEINSLVE